MVAERLISSMALDAKVTFEEYSGENEMSVLPVTVNRAVQISLRVTEAKADGRCRETRRVVNFRRFCTPLSRTKK